MSTTAQILANRNNAQKSTGPKSSEGKAISAKNAVKHGLFATETVIKGENREDFELFREKLLEEFNPAGAVETMLAERIVSLGWRLKRIVRIQDHNGCEHFLARDFCIPGHVLQDRRLKQRPIPLSSRQDPGTR